MKNIITIPHTQSVHHTNKMLGGWADWELTKLGVKQAKRIGRRLAKEIKEKKYIMYASDLPRAKQTAEIVAGFLGIEPIFTAALREISLGEGNGQSKIWARANQLVERVKTIDDRQFAGMESKRDLWNRLSAFENAIMATTDENIILVSHGVSLGIFHAVWLGLDVEMLNQCGISGGSGGISFMHEDADQKRTIDRIGDRSYIR